MPMLTAALRAAPRAGALGIGLALAAGSASAERPSPATTGGNAPAEAVAPAAPGAPEAGGEGTPAVALDKLLKLPTSLEYSVPKRGGSTASEWRQRFGGMRSALESEREALAAARSELEAVAGSTEAWQVGPPIPGGGSNADAPLDYRLRQQIRRPRAAVEGLERDLRELEVEANLAGVPPEWREAPGPAEPPAAGKASDPVPPAPRVTIP